MFFLSYTYMYGSIGGERRRGREGKGGTSIRLDWIGLNRTESDLDFGFHNMDGWMEVEI